MGRWTSAKMVVQRNMDGASIFANGWTCKHFETRALEIMWTTLGHHSDFQQTNAENLWKHMKTQHPPTIATSWLQFCFWVHWIMQPLKTMITLLLVESLVLPIRCCCWSAPTTKHTTMSSSPTMSASWRSFFPSTWPWFRKNLWARNPRNLPWMTRVIFENGYFASRKTPNRRCTLKKARTYRKRWRCLLLTALLTHFSKRLGLDASEWSGAPSPRYTHGTC